MNYIFHLAPYIVEKKSIFQDNLTNALDSNKKKFKSGNTDYCKGHFRHNRELNNRTDDRTQIALSYNREAQV